MYDICLILSVVIFAVVTVHFARSPALSIFHPLTFYLAFHGFIFVLRPILARLLDYDAVYTIYQFYPSMDDKITVVIGANLGLLAFYLACMRVANLPMAFRNDAFAREELQRLGVIFPVVLLFCIPLGSFSMFSRLLAEATGVAQEGMVLDRATGTFVNTTGVGYLNDAQLMLSSACAMIAWIYRFRLPALIPLALFVILRAGTGGRGPMVIALAMTGLFYLYDRKVRLPAMRVAVATVFIFIAFTAIGQDRGLSIRQSIGIAQVEKEYQRSNDDAFLEGMHFANLEYFEYIVYVVPQRSDTYDYFLNNLQIFTEPIPRVLWKDKPAGAPIKPVELFDYGFPIGMTYSLPGVGWYSWGYAGVAIWCAIWGLLLGLVYRGFASGPQNRLAVCGYVILIASLIVGFRDGTLLVMVRTLAFYMFPVAMLFALTKLYAIPTTRKLTERAMREWRDRRNAVDDWPAKGPPVAEDIPFAAERELGNARMAPGSPGDKRKALAQAWRAGKSRPSE